MREAKDFQPHEIVIKIQTSRELEFLMCLFANSNKSLCDVANNKVEGNKIKPFSGTEVYCGDVYDKIETLWRYYNPGSWDNFILINPKNN